MYRLKGFTSITAFANNTPDNVSPLGELSNQSMTYSIEKGYYNKPTSPNVKLVSFTSREDGGDLIEVPVRFTDHVLDIQQWVFDQSVSGSITSDAESFRQLLLGTWGDSMKDVEVGKMVTHKGNWMPSYISWELDDGGDENAIRIWFADEAFRVQYDDYTIIVVPPIEPVDIFQKVKSEVEEALKDFNIPDHHAKVLEKTGEEPYTFLVSNDYDWHDREDEDATLPTTWSVAIYGIAGNNPIIIKDAIADWILKHSAYDRNDWIPVFPDIFTSTEFTIIPMWHRRSIPDETVRGSLYSPITPYDEVLPLAEKYIQYPTHPDHVEKYLVVSGVHYKSLAFLCSGGPENRGFIYRLDEMFPDYALIPATSIDFNRMSKNTVEWTLKLIEACIAAEEMDEYSYIGAHLSRIERQGRMYVGFAHDDVLYLVLARMSMEEAHPEEPAPAE